MGNEFWAAIAGAVIGGVIALLIQLIALRAAAKERATEALERRKALGHALLFKMVQIYSNLYRFAEHLTESFKQAEKIGFVGEPWQILLPLANHPDTVRFSTDEMAMLLSLRDDELFNDLVSMDQVHNSTIDVFRTFKEQRLALTSLLPARMEGTIGHTELTREQTLLLRPKMVELNELITSMRQQCEFDARHAWKTLNRLQALLKDKLGLAYKLQPKSAHDVRGELDVSDMTA